LRLAVIVATPGAGPEPAPLLDARRKGVERGDLVRARVTEGGPLREQRVLDPGQPGLPPAAEGGQWHLLLVSAQAAGDHRAPGSAVPRSELEAHRHALELPLGELVAGPMLVAIVQANADAGRGQIGANPFGDGQHGCALVVGAVD